MTGTAHLKSRLVLAISLRIDQSTWFFLAAPSLRLVSRSTICSARKSRRKCFVPRPLPRFLASCSTTFTHSTRSFSAEQNWQSVWETVSGSNLFVQTLNPTATLSTPLTDQCRRCIDDLQSSRADPTTHCDRELIYLAVFNMV